MPASKIELDADIDGFMAKIREAQAMLRQLKDEAASVQIGGGGGVATGSFAQSVQTGTAGSRATVSASAAASPAGSPSTNTAGTAILFGERVNLAKLQQESPAYYNTLVSTGAIQSPTPGAMLPLSPTASAVTSSAHPGGDWQGPLNYAQYLQVRAAQSPSESVQGPPTSLYDQYQAQQKLQSQIAGAMSMPSAPPSLGLTPLERLGGSYLRGAWAAVGESGAQAFSVMAGEQLAGRPDIIGRASAGWGLAGGLAGAGIGAFFGPFGGLVGAGVGNQFGSALGTLVASGDEATLQRRQALQAVGGLSGLLAGDYRGGMIGQIGDFAQGPNPYFSPGNEAAQRVARTADIRASNIRDRYFYSIDSHGMYQRGGNGDLAMTRDQLAGAYSSTFEALLAGGINPEVGMPYEGGYLRGDPAARRRALGNLTGRGALNRSGSQTNFMEGLVSQATDLLSVRDAGPGVEPLYQNLAENADKYYGASGVNVLNTAVLPILASSQRTGGNYADILTQFGATKTAQYAQVIAPFGTAPGVNLQSLLAAQIGIQQGQRAGAFASTLARGSGAATLTALSGQMQAIEGIPGGTDSLAYAQTSQQFREAGSTAFQQADITTNQIPLTNLRARSAILDVLPFAPASRMATALQTIGAERTEIGYYQRYMQARRATGQLSEQEEDSLTSKIASERVAMAHEEATLSLGMENRLPEMSAGRPNFTSRFSSLNLAALNVDMAGGVYRGFGASNGRQRARQDQWVQDLGFDADEIGPHSRTAPINQKVDTSRMESILSQILGTLQKNGASSSGAPTASRPGTAPNGSMPSGQFPDYSNWRN
jgi:hypothetical protein